MAAELSQNFDAEVELVGSGGGVFDVVVDGKLVYSKGQTGRFPVPDEVSDLLK